MLYILLTSQSSSFSLSNFRASEESGEKVVAEDPVFPLGVFHFGGLEGNVNFALRLKVP